MSIWISIALAAAMWTAAVYFVGRHFRCAGRQMKRNRISNEVNGIFGNSHRIAELAAEDPSNPALAIKWADIAEKAKDWASLHERASDIVKRFPTLLQGRLMLSRALWMQGHHRDAYNFIRAQLSRFPRDTELLDFMANQANSLEDWPEAARVAAIFRRVHPWALRGYVWEVEALIHLGRRAKAAKILRLAEQEIPNNKIIVDLWAKIESTK